MIEDPARECRLQDTNGWTVYRETAVGQKERKTSGAQRYLARGGKRVHVGSYLQVCRNRETLLLMNA